MQKLDVQNLNTTLHTTYKTCKILSSFVQMQMDSFDKEVAVPLK